MVIWDFAYTDLGGCKRDALPTELTARNLIHRSNTTRNNERQKLFFLKKENKWKNLNTYTIISFLRKIYPKFNEFNFFFI